MASAGGGGTVVLGEADEDTKMEGASSGCRARSSDEVRMR